LKHIIQEGERQGGAGEKTVTFGGFCRMIFRNGQPQITQIFTREQ